MINREIPFRPRLEGEFRVRFYNAASEITEKTPTLTIARIAEREIEWVEKDCQYNIEQRKKYRAVWFLFRDLIRASWKACYRNGVIYMSLPTLNGTDMHDTTSPEVKALLRSWMSESRHERLVGYTDFINRMENPGTNKQSIAALIADGDELEKRIKRVHTGEIAIEAAVQPYLQLVRENDRDVFTGLKTSEIWRYFRLTWSTPVETTPGRTMQYLIRDAAHPMHAVMEYSCLKTLASKHKTSLSKTIDKFNDGTGKWGIPYETKQGNKRRYFANYADCKGKGPATDYISNAAVVYGYAVNTLENRLKAKVCELCGTTESDHYEVHHINKLKNLKGKERWEIAMIAKHRKTLVVCRDCHRSIIHKK